MGKKVLQKLSNPGNAPSATLSSCIKTLLDYTSVSNTPLSSQGSLLTPRYMALPIGCGSAAEPQVIQVVKRSITSSPCAAVYSIYEHTCGVLAGRAYTLGRLRKKNACTSYEVLEALINDGNGPSLSPTAKQLVLAVQHCCLVLRATKLASRLGGSETELMAALARDEEHIMRPLELITDDDKSDILHLRGPIVADLLNLLHLPSEEYSGLDSSSLAIGRFRYLSMRSKCIRRWSRTLQSILRASALNIAVGHSHKELPSHCWWVVWRYLQG
ncbi:uncharacterized protein PHACADRAFT_33591 [Phanerochaete carnosa HHB-10118-sp]|uniref:Uncharacterized protein n=1 Tax=Phanerochaete carnosa (strain HHB-10118-sp) TaxID=650164 RepID=K5WG50_PHACS|nr:uncharacterized protein PHACADRAFT_33591 [Phanerochaete carnosa HHB-10118-sp]EKM49177.1 hypothetical protein PHACADRAFT_33591 [Phanerochaete carnosa HHB-10118-sp]